MDEQMICVMNCICPQLKSHLMGMDYKAKFQMNNGGGLVTGSFQTIVSYASHWLRAINSLFTSFLRPSASSATAFLFSLYPKRRITSCSSVEEHEIKEFLSRSKWFELRGISVPLYQLCEVRGIGSASR